ncbi:MAG: DMT family transporter [Proteobacteria bacterium]|nr:DMT family transporter [Pseudomonadota bacterium]MBU1584802.1 DMT family transporter [Pseudomonadota bacterium]MBU2629525.1 DMT family transporter [Pseudomonadota bacterium]
MPYTGELIAIGTVFCWTISVQFFEAASKRVGATSVNIIRLSVALILFGLLLFFRHGYIIPIHFPAHAWIFLSLSGVIGFFMGDIFLFKALVELGPRVAMLIFSLSAPTAAVIGWLFLDETYVLHQWAGMVITLSGVGIVILERNQKTSRPSKLKNRDISIKGVLFGVGAMLGQAVGYILSKAGMQADAGYLDAFSATQIRAIAAFLCFLVFFTVTGKWKNVITALKDTKAVLFTATGSAIGPFLGVSLSLLVLHYLTTGVASTFLSLVPVFIIPFSIFVHKENVSIRAAAGAVTAVFGIYLLMS